MPGTAPASPPRVTWPLGATGSGYYRGASGQGHHHAVLGWPDVWTRYVTVTLVLVQSGSAVGCSPHFMENLHYSRTGVRAVLAAKALLKNSLPLLGWSAQGSTEG